MSIKKVKNLEGRINKRIGKIMNTKKVSISPADMTIMSIGMINNAKGVTEPMVTITGLDYKNSILKKELIIHR